MKNEPALTVGTITAAVAAVLSLLVAFGLHLSDDQQKAILAVVTIVAPLLGAVFIRGKVSPAE